MLAGLAQTKINQHENENRHYVVFALGRLHLAFIERLKQLRQKRPDEILKPAAQQHCHIRRESAFLSWLWVRGPHLAIAQPRRNAVKNRQAGPFPGKDELLPVDKERQARLSGRVKCAALRGLDGFLFTH